MPVVKQPAATMDFANNTCAPIAPAVIVRNAYKSFKSTVKKGDDNFENGEIKVLENFSMTVQTGHLYSVIGSSGCGKTTLLSCLIGALKLDHGHLSVFGSKTLPVSPNRWQRIGYMPQEISLYQDFSIFETLMYFGKLFDTGKGRTSKAYLLGRIEFLKELLALPDNLDRTVGTLSGGQQRRVSFAVALVTEPELLLLDEPTSGVDPLIRECIWDHLAWLASTKRTTIILTTHYVDEARGSNMVGVMRDGRLIAEDSPANLLRNFEVDSLENAFFHLCKQQEDFSLATSTPTASLNSKGLSNTLHSSPKRSLSRSKSIFPVERRVQNSSRRLMALAEKNFKTLTRNLWALAFISLMPALTMLVIYIAFQKDPNGIKLGVVNQDVKNGTDCFSPENLVSSCMAGYLSCKYIDEVTATDAINLNSYDSMEEAREAVALGEIWGIISFPENYTNSVTSNSLMEFMEDRKKMAEEARNDTKITVNLDQTNTMIYAKIMRTLYDAFERYAKRNLRDCEFDEKIAEFPLQYGEPILGNKDMTSLDYIAPGMAISNLFFFPACVCVRYILEKRQGTMDRCMAGGTQPYEILVAYAIPEAGVLVAQFSLVYIILHYGCSLGSSPLELPFNFLLTLTLCVIQGFNGLSAGLLVGVLLNDAAQAAMIVISTIFPLSFISGILWPPEGMPKVLQYISLALPLNLPSESLRSLMIRGWDITHPSVWPGFVVACGYTSLFFLGTLLILKIQANKK